MPICRSSVDTNSLYPHYGHPGITNDLNYRFHSSHITSISQELYESNKTKCDPLVKAKGSGAQPRGSLAPPPFHPLASSLLPKLWILMTLSNVLWNVSLMSLYLSINNQIRSPIEIKYTSGICISRG